MLRKCIVLNTLELTPKKKDLFNSLFKEYLKALELTSLHLPVADSSTELHHLTYLDIRKTSLLPSDIVQEARKDIWKFRKHIKNKGFDGEFKFWGCSIRLNKRWFKLIKSKRGNPCFTVTYSPRKSFAIPVKKDKQLQRFNSFVSNGWVFDNISLLKDARISVVLEKEFEKPSDNKRFVLGIDIGSACLASVSIFDNKSGKVVKQLYFGRDIALRQQRFSRQRARLQSLADLGSNYAKKKLKLLRHKQANFVKTRSGQIAKEIVNLAKSYNTGIAIEMLKNIRGRKGRFNRTANRKISRIPYGLFVQFLKSSCEQFSTPFYEVDSYHTSKWCPRCGAVNNGHQSGNYNIYKCRKCGFTCNSDRKASLAVAVKSVLERKTQHSVNLSSIQISKTQVPVNGLLRPNAVGSSFAVQHINQPMESHLTC